uniref:Hypothetical secreted peptide n=1 Tax=Simulium nigrimanum TaxID=683695 RepID=D1FQ26_SIMNI
MKLFTTVCAIVVCIALFGATAEAGPFFFGAIRRFVEPFVPKVNATNSGTSFQLPFGLGGGSTESNGDGGASGYASGPNGSVGASGSGSGASGSANGSGASGSAGADANADSSQGNDYDSDYSQ